MPAECDLVGRSFKAQFKYADKLGSRFVVIAGDDELASGVWKIQGHGEQRGKPPSRAGEIQMNWPGRNKVLHI